MAGEQGFGPESFLRIVQEKLGLIETTQAAAIQSAAKAAYRSIRAGRRFYLLGSGHSHMIAEEMYTRAGGLGCVSPMLPPELMLHEHPHKSTLLEREASYAGVLLAMYPLTKGDTLLLASNSGRNAMMVELAIRARARGVFIVALTSLAGGALQASRHPSGKKLGDCADVVIDNCGDDGDVSCHIEGCKAMMGATSSIAGCYVAQKLGMEIAGLFRADGLEPPVFLSSNVDGGDEWNKALFAQIERGDYGRP